MDFFDTSSSTSFNANPQITENIICSVLTFIFAIGSINGALTGIATETGLFRGAGIGAISEAVFSIEVVESAISFWHSNGSYVLSILYVIDILIRMITGKIAREQVRLLLHSTVQNRMDTVDTSFFEFLDIFETEDMRGMRTDSINQINKFKISINNNVIENMCCSVCIQDFKTGETARCLPRCKHIFHVQCIDRWLLRRGNCPLCRQNIQ